MTSENYLQQDIPSIMTKHANTATSNFGGQKQLIKRPKANVIVIAPLLTRFFRIFHPPIIHNT